MRLKTKRTICPKVRHAGFTLVELLVVIGIISVLIGILLPALNAARRQADATKCLSNLKQLGIAFNLYANDNKGTWPVTVWRHEVRSKNYFYNNGTDDPLTTTPRNWYWHMFIQKYVNSKIARDQAANVDRDYVAKNNIIWGCPQWRPWIALDFNNGYNLDEVGYGMNWNPTYRGNFPSATNPDVRSMGQDTDSGPLTVAPAWEHRAYRQMWGATSGSNGKPGRFFKQVEWTQASERGLVCDSEYFTPALDTPPEADGYPKPQASHIYQNYGPYNLDFFRHGKPGKAMTFEGRPSLDTKGGKPGINMLFCDGHAATLNTYGDVYLALRRKLR